MNTHSEITMLNATVALTVLKTAPATVTNQALWALSGNLLTSSKNCLKSIQPVPAA